jgi:predicted nuclease with TOPRIM domain
MPDDIVTRGDLEALRSELKDAIHSVRTELKDELAITRLEVAQLRTDMIERFGSVQAEFGSVQAEFGAVQAEFGAVRADLADVRKDLAVLQVDIRKDLAVLQVDIRKDLAAMQHSMATFERHTEQLRTDMQRWQLSTTRQLWTMVSVVSGAVIVGILKLVFFP